MSDIEKMKRYLHTRLNALTPGELTAFADELEGIARWIRSLNQLPEPLRAAVVEGDPRPEEIPTGRDEESAAEAEPSRPLVVPDDREEPPRGDEFRRDLRGGMLWPAGLRVPEVFVRERQLVTGDRLTYRALPAVNGDPLRYHFEVVGRGPGQEPRERVERSFAIIEEEAGVLVVRRTASDGAVPQPVVVLPLDIATLHLQRGDVVDLAHWADTPDVVRVCWLHRTATLPDDSLEEPTLANGKVKAPTPRPKKAPPDPVLRGKRVLIIGNEPRRPQYADAIALRGGEMEWLSGNEPEDRMNAALHRVDAAIVLTGHCSHHASETAVALGKAAGVPVRRISADGIKSVADWAVKLAAPPSDDPLEAEGG